MEIFEIFLGMTTLFFILLGVKNLLSGKLKDKFCVICITVTLTWIVLIILKFLGFYENLILTSLLMGQTVIGIFYLAENKVEKSLTVFRLPFLLSLTFIAYSILVFPSNFIEILGLIFILWGTFYFVYSYRKSNKLRSLVNKLVECCKKW